MKTAGREDPNRWATKPSTRVHGAAAQNRSRSITWAGKQETFRPQGTCFFLTSPFMELLGTWPAVSAIATQGWTLFTATLILAYHKQVKIIIHYDRSELAI